ncbi:hypothetical protein CHLRE_04g227350v5 [Chlamydomonas reinhardtii]|uniref:CCR4-NOT transcription complex subunit 3 n=1 Tax=Chlamydomonas reinhardtii TaxID=3055 RepID=A0A2K3DUR5_CHLRE|nr:uncharacterized protein CHLRE_04g227350v5 [Chlamydomonas reinhardtii]PNW84264.1 hypothetical protein CHLRE_04g227350v5 [Chlamydomonas reinhardtii]
MAAERKLKAEIDRTLKKVQEGQEVFDEIWNQYLAHKQAHDQENQNQRDKLEGELKKEIKKLQRLREQIKGWIAGADIKDKQPLIDARKSIERDMERFKACEKESKAKGNAAGGADRDPKQRAKDEARDWINTVVDQLTEKVETMEAEMEELQANVKKRQKPPARLTALEETVGRHKEHVDRLEKVLRCIDNETIQPDELSDLKEDMDMYLGSEDGDDSGMDMTHVDDMYVMFQDRLDAVDNAAPAAPLHSVKHGKGAREKELEEAREKERERERAAAAAAKAQLIAQGNTNLKLHDDDEVRKPGPTPPATGKGGAATAAAAGLPMAVPPLAAPAPAVAAGSARQTAPPTPAKEPDSGTVTPRTTAVVPVAASPGPGLVTATSETLSPLPPRGAPPGVPAPPGPSQPPAPGTQLGPGGRAASGPLPAVAANGTAAGDAAAPGGVPRWLAAAASTPGHTGAASSAGPATGHQSTGPSAGQSQDASVDSRTDGPIAGPGGLQDSAPSGPGVASGPFVTPSSGPTAGSAADALASRVAGMGLGTAAVGLGGPGAPQHGGAGHGVGAGVGPAGTGVGMGANVMAGSVMLPGDLPPVVPAYSVAAAKQVLEACYARGVMPQLSDTEWKHTRPRHPVAVPASYPKTTPEVIDNPALFRKMDPECLFFAFYFQPNTYQQFLAAHELKRQSWRFHRHHNAWFQRFTEPSVTSDEYEQGAYVYFDYNIVHDDMQTGWCYRRKENFTFRYDALEDELRVANLTPQQTVAMAMAQAAGLQG